MAEAAPVDLTTVRCGFCLQRGKLETPKSLPCSHIHCLTCLTDNYDVYGVVKCPWCREVYDVTVNSLPSVCVREDNSTSCNVCTRKMIRNQSAVCYCKFCAKLFCAKHQESHDDTNDDHLKITIDEYKQKARKLEIRVCADHKEFPYILGCKVCATLFCVQCVTGIGVCTNGSAHQLVNIDILVSELTAIDKVISQEERLAALFKLISKVISDFDTETEKFLTILLTRRDQQSNALQLKYEKLEKEMLEGRRKTKSDMTRFMEEDVGVKWSDMNKNRMKIEAQLKHSHQVDIVRSYTKIKDGLETLLLDVLPKLELHNVITLEVKEEREDIEVEIVSAEDIFISLGEGLTISTLPKSLTSLQTVQNEGLGTVNVHDLAGRQIRMAEAAPVDLTTVQCGFCLQRGGLETPKSLPCSHIHCRTCLTDNYDVYGVVKCPWCREVYDVTVNSLPSAYVREDNSTSCNVCTRKRMRNQSAVSYCTFCSKLLCAKHRESHDDTNDDHCKITIDEYKQQATKLEMRVCADHKEFPYILRCKVCASLFCLQCITGSGICTNGSAHQLVNIDILVSELTAIDEVISQEERLAALFKLISKVISDFDTETEKLLKTLRIQGDQQPKALQLKYQILEKEMLEGRRKTKSDMTRFMEEDVGVKWSDMNKNRVKIEAQLKHSHQVDIARGYTEIKDGIEALLLDELPQLELSNVMTLKVKEERRYIEVEVVSEEDRRISLDEGLTIFTLPKSLTLLQTVEVSTTCTAACMYKGKTYVGLTSRGALDRIQENYQLTKSFITASGNVNGVTVYKDHIYTLVHGNGAHIRIYDLTGRLVSSWTHTDKSRLNKLDIVDNQVVIPDRLNKRLTMYSLAGEVTKHLPCALLGNGITAICAVDSHTVVVSDQSSSKVFKVDTITGKIVWVSGRIQKPQGVVCDRSKYLLVTNQSSKTTIWVLDAKTGNLLTLLTDPTERSNSNVYDLHISGNTLIVPRYGAMKVLFYQLK